MADAPAFEPPAEASPNPLPQPRPKLSIAHLMLWTLGTAIVLAFSRAQFGPIGSAGTEVEEAFAGNARGTYLRILAIVTAPFTGIDRPIVRQVQKDSPAITPPVSAWWSP